VPKSWNCEGIDRSSIVRRALGPKARPAIPSIVGTAQNRAPRMKATVALVESIDATRPMAIIKTPISQ
jgi:hypothetical protein